MTIPTFVEVENWSDDWEGSDEECVAAPGGDLCVELTWGASLWYDPGEPGAGPIDCEPPGNRYDPSEPGPRAQAGEGTCTYEYQSHTPGAAHEATVGVTYEFTWESSSGWAGVFDPMDETASFSRVVDEVQTTVSDIELEG